MTFQRLTVKLTRVLISHPRVRGWNTHFCVNDGHRSLLKAIRAWKPNWRDGMIRRCWRLSLRSCNIMCILHMRCFLCIFHMYIVYIYTYDYRIIHISYVWYKILYGKKQNGYGSKSSCQTHTNIYVFSTCSFSHHPIKHIWCCWGQYLWGHNTNPSGYNLNSLDLTRNSLHNTTSWWFQPTWKILVKMGIFPR